MKSGEFEADDGCRAIATVRLLVESSAWHWAAVRHEEIDRHWSVKSTANPHFFNGTIHLLTALEMRDASAEGRLVKTDFKSFLYWRDHGFPEAGVRDGFGSALIRARDGAILLGRQSAGHINSGMTYLPGGFIDDRDVGADGIVRLGDSIAREVAEETGLELADLVPSDGFLVTRAGPQVSFARTFLSPLDGEALARRVREFLSRQSGAELADVVLVREPADCASLAMPAFARHLLPVVLRAP